MRRIGRLAIGVALGVSLAGASSAAADLPSHVLGDSLDADAAAPLLRRWRPDTAGETRARAVVRRAEALAVWSDAGRARVHDAVSVALDGVTEAERSAFVAHGAPAIPFRLYHGELARPARGPVLYDFGERERARDGTVHRHTGWTIDTRIGAEVRAVAYGTVVYARWLVGLGTTVVVDHGDGYHTVYARLSEVDVRPGSSLQAGGRIGGAGSTLYFEVRDQGVPVDPAEWLR